MLESEFKRRKLKNCWEGEASQRITACFHLAIFFPELSPRPAAEYLPPLNNPSKCTVSHPHEVASRQD
jgi:hypothetical protein